jgi:hypothetical protein
MDNDDKIKQEYTEYLSNIRQSEQLIKENDWYKKKYGPYVGENRGMHNWKNLFRKPTMNEWVILFMLVMGLFSAYAYKIDITACRDYYENNLCTLCENQKEIVTNPFLRISNDTWNQTFNQTLNLTLKEESSGESGG